MENNNNNRKKVFNFKKQLDVGNIGEQLFLDTYEGAVKSTDLKYDFLIGDTKVELKTDSWRMEDTPNFFMEKISNSNKNSIGGPYRAMQDNIDFFVYLFIKDNVFFWFDSKRLCRTLDRLTKNMKYHKIWNRSYDTLGHLIPRDSVKHLVIQKDEVCNKNI